MSHSIDDDFELKAFEPIFHLVEQAMDVALGLNIELLSSRTKSIDIAFPRIIFSYLCNQRGIHPMFIGRKIKRDRSSIIANFKSYERYYGYDKTFTLLANSVIKRLKEIENEE